jgi:phosphoesterase RecJ-like protein
MLEYQKQFTKVFQKILQAENILLICHKRPDGDALGAMCALGCYLDSINKKHMLFNIDKIAESFNYLPCAEKFVHDPAKIEGINFDLILILDSSSLDITGVEDYLQKVKESSFLINIDHHLTNNDFGHLNLVVEDTSSASEIIYNLFKHNKIYIDKSIANSLLTGIISDSGGFSNAATTISSIDAASHLLIRGGRLPKVVKQNYQNQSLTSLKLWGKVLARLEQNKKYGIAYTYITHKDLIEHKVGEEAVEGISNFLNNLKGSKAMIFLKEKKPGEINVSMRTTNDLIDLAKLAKIVGGGGHRKAAGFSVKGRLVEENGRIRIV